MDYQMKLGLKRSRYYDETEQESNKRYKVSEEVLGKESGIKITSKDNHIYFYSSVNKTSALELNNEIRSITNSLMIYANKMNSNPPPIYLHINSYGGSVFAALSVIDTIMYNNIPIYTIVEGAAASAATLISVCGKKRFITKNSYMLVHQLSSGFWGKMAEFEDEIKNLKSLMKIIKKIYQKHSTIPDDKIDEILKHDIWWKSKKCLKYGLVDKIIKSSNSFYLEQEKDEY